MKRILVLAAAFALSATAASADCVGHAKDTVSVDTKMTTASVTMAEQSTPEEAQLLLKKEEAKATE